MRIWRSCRVAETCLARCIIAGLRVIRQITMLRSHRCPSPSMSHAASPTVCRQHYSFVTAHEQTIMRHSHTSKIQISVGEDMSIRHVPYDFPPLAKPFCSTTYLAPTKEAKESTENDTRRLCPPLTAMLHCQKGRPTKYDPFCAYLRHSHLAYRCSLSL